MKNRKLSLKNLFSNNKFVLAFSIVVAFFIWSSVVINLSPEDTRVIENVKVTVQSNIASGLELKTFGNDDMTVDVTVSGKRYAISSAALSADDISVVAKGDYIDSAGKYTLSITGTPVDSNAAFDIVRLSETSMTVYYDFLKQQEFNVSVDLTADNGIVPDGYISDNPISSLSTVTVSGPATEVNKISSIVAAATLDAPVTETTILNAEISVQTTNNTNTLNYITFTEDTESCTVTVPVYMKKEVRLNVHYVNLPASYGDKRPSAVITPSTLTVAAAKSVIEDMETLDIGSVDFSSLAAADNIITFSTSDIDEVKVVDDVSEITVRLDFSGYSTSTVDIPASNINCLNVPEGYTAKTSSGIESVVLVGPEEDVSALTSSDVFAKIDFSSLTGTNGKTDITTGSHILKADVYITNSAYNTCWVYGTYKNVVSIMGGSASTES